MAVNKISGLKPKQGADTGGNSTGGNMGRQSFLRHIERFKRSLVNLPQGAKLVYVTRRKDGCCVIAVDDFAGEEASIILPGDSDSFNPVFGSGGEKVYYLTEVAGFFQVAEYDLGTKKKEILTEDPVHKVGLVYDRWSDSLLFSAVETVDNNEFFASNKWSQCYSLRLSSRLKEKLKAKGICKAMGRQWAVSYTYGDSDNELLANFWETGRPDRSPQILFNNRGCEIWGEPRIAGNLFLLSFCDHGKTGFRVFDLERRQLLFLREWQEKNGYLLKTFDLLPGGVVAGFAEVAENKRRLFLADRTTTDLKFLPAEIGADICPIWLTALNGSTCSVLDNTGGLSIISWKPKPRSPVLLPGTVWIETRRLFGIMPAFSWYIPSAGEEKCRC